MSIKFNLSLVLVGPLVKTIKMNHLQKSPISGFLVFSQVLRKNHPISIVEPHLKWVQVNRQKNISK